MKSHLSPRIANCMREASEQGLHRPLPWTAIFGTDAQKLARIIFRVREVRFRSANDTRGKAIEFLDLRMRLKT